MVKPISDYKNEKNYIYNKDTSMWQWAFEFLRRNHDYQNDVQYYLDVCNSVVDGFNPFLPPDLEIKQLENYYERLDEMVRHYEPPIKEGETENEWWVRLASEKQSGKSTPLNIWLAAKWGLSDLFYPYSEFSLSNVSFKDAASKVTIAGHGWFADKKNTLVSAADKQAFVINYNLPLLPQLAAIKSYAVRYKQWLTKELNLKPQPNIRNRSKLYNIYLRCLDAADSGLSESQMAKIICPHKSNNYPDYYGTKTISDYLDAAKKLRDHSYIYLPLIK